MDLDAYQSMVADMTPAALQKARAEIQQRLRVAYRSTTLRYDRGQLERVQDLEVKLHVVQTEINVRLA